MTRSFKIVEGDLALSGSTLTTVSGVEKLIQDVDTWLKENFRVDRFHPQYGSVLDSMIGEVLDDTTEHRVQIEVLRVLSNYQQLQLQRVQKSPDFFSADELLDSINEVEVAVNYDSVQVNISMTTGSGRTVESNVSIES